MVFDNKEAMAYVLFRELKISRDNALRIVNEQCKLVVGLTKLANKPYRSRRTSHVTGRKKTP